MLTGRQINELIDKLLPTYLEDKISLSEIRNLLESKGLEEQQIAAIVRDLGNKRLQLEKKKSRSDFITSNSLFPLIITTVGLVSTIWLWKMGWIAGISIAVTGYGLVSFFRSLNLQ